MSDLLNFIIGSYAMGWCLNAITARKKRMLDVCQFVRAFLLAPFVLTILVGILVGVVLALLEVIIPHIVAVMVFTAISLATMAIFGAIGHFVIKPAAKKAIGVAKPFSDKICVVIYKDLP